METMEALMVPLMMATLAVVVASQVDAVRAELSSLLRVIPLYVAFLVAMAPLGILTGRLFGQNAPATRAVVFSGATRNSPVALALPETLALVAIVVVTQTLVELVCMVTYVQLTPRVVPHCPVPVP